VAKLDVSISVPLPPAEVWDRASDLSQYDKWLSIHDGWRGELPEQLSEGVQIVSVVAVKGLRNRVTWTLKKYDPPKQLQLTGSGKGGVKIKLALTVSAEGPNSVLKLDVDLGGAPLFGPVGSGVARALKGDIEKSLKTFVSLYS
jgi:carbon monoxide dehydrogenase subunit G